ncbi:hypothetical protein D1007_59010 [Hordeum vulgare]|nr:hypothetical protein D1007_59010 [Hordeum vulgare]
MEAVKRKQLEAAEKLLASGDLRRARMHVDMAVAMDRSGACPEAQRARYSRRRSIYWLQEEEVEAMEAVKRKQLEAVEKLLAPSAYRVLAVAANNAGHYAVLGVAAPLSGRPTRESHDAGKAQHKALCDAFEAAGKSSALVKQAFSALTDIRKNEGRPPYPIILLLLPSSWTSRWRRSRRGTAAADEQEEEEEEEDYYASGGRRR